MVVTDLRPNLIKLTPSEVNATSDNQRQSKAVRRILAEDNNWNLAIVPLLKDLALNHIIKNFKENPILENLNSKDKGKVLEGISVSIPLTVTAHLINDEGYWKRCCKAKWNVCDVSMYEGNWKRMFFEKYLQSVVEDYVPEQTDFSVVKDAIDACSPYVKKLEIGQLLPPGKVERRLDDDISEVASDIDSEHSPIDHFNFEHLLDKLPYLEELHIQYCVRDCGMNFAWNLFQFTQLDCITLANSLRRCQNLKVFSLHQSKVDDSKVRILARQLLDHPTLVELDFSHNCISDRGAKAIAKLINNRCPNLEKVSLRNNIIRVEGAKAVAFALSKSNKLKEIDLRLNRVEDEGGQAIMRSLIKNCGLQKISLASNDLSERTAAVLTQVLHKNETLISVDLSGNRIGPDGGKQIQEGIEKNQTLLELDLRLTEAGQESEYCINQKLKVNREVTRKSKNGSRHSPL